MATRRPRAIGRAIGRSKWLPSLGKDRRFWKFPYHAETGQNPTLILILTFLTLPQLSPCFLPTCLLCAY